MNKRTNNRTFELRVLIGFESYSVNLFFLFSERTNKQMNERTNKLLYRAEGLNQVRIPLSYCFFFFSLFVWNRATLAEIPVRYLFFSFVTTQICFGAQGVFPFFCIFIAYAQLPVYYFRRTVNILRLISKMLCILLVSKEAKNHIQPLNITNQLKSD